MKFAAFIAVAAAADFHPDHSAWADVDAIKIHGFVRACKEPLEDMIDNLAATTTMYHRRNRKGFEGINSLVSTQKAMFESRDKFDQLEGAREQFDPFYAKGSSIWNQYLGNHKALWTAIDQCDKLSDKYSRCTAAQKRQLRGLDQMYSSMTEHCELEADPKNIAKLRKYALAHKGLELEEEEFDF